MSDDELYPATIAEANAAILLLREQGSMIAAEAVEKLLQHCGKPALRPNVMRCAKCKLRVTGALTAAACPNGCGPLWAATWEEECLTAERDRDEFLQIAQRIAIEKAELRREVERLRDCATTRCSKCQGLRIVPIGDGYSVNPCPDCTQPPDPQPAKDEGREVVVAELPPEGHPLRKIGERLTSLLDDDQWNNIEPLLIEAWDRQHRAQQVDDLAALVGRLAHSLKNVKKDHRVAGAALDYLKRHGLEGSPLRAQPTGAAEATDHECYWVPVQERGREFFRCGFGCGNERTEAEMVDNMRKGGK